MWLRSPAAACGWLLAVVSTSQRRLVGAGLLGCPATLQLQPELHRVGRLRLCSAVHAGAHRPLTATPALLCAQVNSSLTTEREFARRLGEEASKTKADLKAALSSSAALAGELAASPLVPSCFSPAGCLFLGKWRQAGELHCGTTCSRWHARWVPRRAGSACGHVVSAPNHPPS